MKKTITITKETMQNVCGIAQAARITIEQIGDHVEVFRAATGDFIVAIKGDINDLNPIKRKIIAFVGCAIVCSKALS